MQTIGNQIRAARESKGMTREALAEALQTDVKWLDAWERDEAVPDKRQIDRLSEVLGAVITDSHSLQKQREADAKLEATKAAEFLGKSKRPAAQEDGKGKWLWLIPLAVALAAAVLLMTTHQSDNDAANRRIDDLVKSVISLENGVEALDGRASGLEGGVEALEEDMAALTRTAGQTAQRLDAWEAAAGSPVTLNGKQIVFYPAAGAPMTVSAAASTQVILTGYNMAWIEQTAFSSEVSPDLAVTIARDGQVTLEGASAADEWIDLTPAAGIAADGPVLFTLYANKTYYLSGCQLVYFDAEGSEQTIDQGVGIAAARNAVAYMPTENIQVRGIRYPIAAKRHYASTLSWQPYVGTVRPETWLPCSRSVYEYTGETLTVYGREGMNVLSSADGVNVTVSCLQNDWEAQQAMAAAETAAQTPAVYGRIDFSTAYFYGNGFYDLTRDWVWSKNYGTYVIPVEEGAAYFYSGKAVSDVFSLDENMKIVEELKPVKTGRGYAYTPTVPERMKYITYWLPKDGTLGDMTYWYSSRPLTDSLLLPAGNDSPLRIAFDGDSIVGLGDEGAPKGWQAGYYDSMGRWVEDGHYYSTEYRLFRKGDVIDAANTGLRFGLQGVGPDGRFSMMSGGKAYTFQTDVYATLWYEYIPENLKWADAAAELTTEEARYFLRYFSAAERAENPWAGKTWYSFGTALSDVGLNDEAGNGGHGGKWPLYVDAASGMRRMNCAVTGGGITESGSVKEMILQTPYDTDLVTLELLSGEGLARLGEIGDRTEDTFLGSLNQCLEYLTYRTRARVVFIALSETAAENALSADRLQYRAALEKVKALCALYGVPVIDADGAAASLKQVQFKGAESNPLSTYLGGEIYGRYIWAALKRIAPNDMPSMEASELPEETEAPVPEPTETPMPTEAPVATETPETTEAPVVTETPQAAETPAATEAPAPTGTPAPGSTGVFGGDAQ